MSPLVALVDCNNFYASCERVMAPRLEGKPIIVLSNNDGCVVARSNEAKALGIAMGVPEFQIRSLIRAHHVEVFSSNYTLYGDLSQRVMETLEQFSPNIEVYSIDEAFLSLVGFERRDLTEYGRQIRRTVKQWTGIPVSIGIAETKTLAKIANRIAKKHPEYGGVFDLSAYPDRTGLLETVAVEEIWGIGPNHARLLKQHGISKARQLREADDQWIRKHIGITGVRLVHELRGQSCLELEECPAPKQSIACSRSFGRPVWTLDEMEEAVASYTSRVAEKLRSGGLAATVLTVSVMTNEFRDDPQYRNSVTCSLPVGTNITSELIRAATEGLRTIFRKGYRYKKAGVMVTGLVSANQVQPDLFDHQDRVRSTRLMAALDAINERWGSGTLQYAAGGIAISWKAQFHQRSPAYTTKWEELPVARA